MLENYTYVLIFLLIGLVFSFAAILINKLIATPKRGEKSQETYESGMETIGSSWIQFRGTYTLYALLFLIFDVEIVFLFPAVLAYHDEVGLNGLVLILVFLGILSLGIVYAFRKKMTEWK